MKHTPSPWEAETHTVQDGKGGYKYARVYRKHKYSKEIALVTTRIDSDEDKANAQLIAAAPELLEACKEALVVLLGYTGLHRQTKDKLCSALRKAGM